MRGRQAGFAARTAGVVVVATLGLALTSACGSGAGPAEESTNAPSAVRTTPAKEQREQASPSAAPAKKSPAPAAASTVKVPNGVGLDYQSAQDLWRAAGLIVAPATDATGAHRLPVIDSNWVVLSQDPKAGTKVPKESIITATVKKYSDD
ncbi:PASTA domain-containing protein [Actinoplanes regularis]|uniref:PASTA domain-containing protein n=1 Tax=Actinoplanes regularis TaxID=52697 RepID=A0A239FU27_9ACTN|nr:PASTA domain-containing protein [Actinoplanes regularis]GIE90126.1 hypothetical protein Are01nite_66060 [Actinoplanes regularis]SNS60646.1 PASTA domain-containing protein [Actinoplanes regularis]